MRDAERVNEQFADWLDKKTTLQLHFNESLHNKRDFHNPSMVKKLLDYANLVECQTNLPQAIFDPRGLPPFDYERVSANQRREYDERRK